MNILLFDGRNAPVTNDSEMFDLPPTIKEVNTASAKSEREPMKDTVILATVVCPIVRTVFELPQLPFEFQGIFDKIEYFPVVVLIVSGPIRKGG
jgi:hypothetical protein